MSSITYKSLEARRFGVVNQPVNINNNSTLTSVTSEEDTLRIGFVFSCNYEPNVAVIRIEGEMDMKEEKDVVSKVVSSWKESQQKNVPNDIAERIHNSILSNCIVEATILARDINLPAPLPAPHVSLGKADSPDKMERATRVDTQSYIR